MLAPQEPRFAELAPARRIERVILRWLDALAPHRAVTRQILVGKLYPGHPHLLAALAVRLSRTVQWVREAALLRGGPPRRQLEEIALTWLFVATVALWSVDASAGQQATRRFLAGRLRWAERIQSWCPRPVPVRTAYPARPDRRRAHRR
jgi:AcrR family transcriptional regulator